MHTSGTQPAAQIPIPVNTLELGGRKSPQCLIDTIYSFLNAGRGRNWSKQVTISFKHLKLFGSEPLPLSPSLPDTVIGWADWVMSAGTLSH